MNKNMFLTSTPRRKDDASNGLPVTSNSCLDNDNEDTISSKFDNLNVWCKNQETDRKMTEDLVDKLSKDNSALRIDVEGLQCKINNLETQIKTLQTSQANYNNLENKLNELSIQLHKTQEIPKITLDENIITKYLSQKLNKFNIHVQKELSKVNNTIQSISENNDFFGNGDNYGSSAGFHISDDESDGNSNFARQTDSDTSPVKPIKTLINDKTKPIVPVKDSIITLNNQAKESPDVNGSVFKQVLQPKHNLFYSNSTTSNNMFGNSENLLSSSSSPQNTNIFAQKNIDGSTLKKSDEDSSVKSSIFNTKIDDNVSSTHNIFNVKPEANANIFNKHVESKPNKNIYDSQPGLFNKSNDTNTRSNIFVSDKSITDSSESKPTALNNTAVQSGSLFGNKNEQTKNLFVNAADTENSLFGNTSGQSKSLFGQGNSLFGNSSGQGNSLFGNNEKSTSLFGNNEKSTSLFGNSNEKSSSLFGSLTTNTNSSPITNFSDFKFKSSENSIFKPSGKLFENVTKKDQNNEWTENNEEHENDEECSAQFEPIVELPVVNIQTDQDVFDELFKSRCKLFRLVDGEWKERGTGDIKVVKEKKPDADGNDRYRLIMRREKIAKLGCNHLISKTCPVFSSMQNSKSVCWFAVDYSEGEMRQEKFAVRFKDESILNDFKKAVEDVQNLLLK